MKRRRPTIARRAAWILVGTTALLPTLAAPAAARNEVIPLESPAWFVEGAGGYVYRKIDDHTARVGDLTTTILGSTSSAWQVGGSVTVPLALGFGVRGRVRGGGEDVTVEALDSDRSRIAGGGELFWRDPTKGQIAVGYAYERTSQEPGFPVDSVRSHGVPVRASLYMPDLEPGTVDWNVGFEYDWVEVRGPLSSNDEWAYTLTASSIWYVNRFVSFEGGAEYFRSLAPSQSDRVEGVFRLELLVPSGTRHFGTVAVHGRIGRDELKDFGVYGDENRLTWAVGASVSVHFPGVTSLVELNRACR